MGVRQRDEPDGNNGRRHASPENNGYTSVSAAGYHAQCGRDLVCEQPVSAARCHAVGECADGKRLLIGGPNVDLADGGVRIKRG